MTVNVYWIPYHVRDGKWVRIASVRLLSFDKLRMNGAKLAMTRLRRTFGAG